MQRPIILLMLGILWALALAHSAVAREDQSADAWKVLPPDTLILGELSAAYVAWSDTPVLVSFHAEQVRIRLFEDRFFEGPLHTRVEDPTKSREVAWTLRHTEMKFFPAKIGSLGFVAGADAPLAFRAPVPLDAQMQAYSEVGNPSSSPYFRPESDFFSAEVVGPHLHFESIGELTVTGSGGLHIFGATVQFTSERNTSTISTGRFQESAATARYVWLYVEYQNATINTMSEETPIEIATRHPVAGPPHVPEDPRVLRESSSQWSLLGIVLLVGGVLGAGGMWHRVRRQSSKLLHVPAVPSLDGPLPTLLRLAAEGEDEEDWRKALGNLQAARRLQPEDYELAMREATCHRNLEDAKAALACYEEAALLKDTGEPYYWAAVLAVRQGNLPLARRYVEAALARDPSLAAEFAMDDLFRDACAPRGEAGAGGEDWPT